MKSSSPPSNPAWERLLHIIAETGRKDIATFARSIGLKSASSLYIIRKNGVIGNKHARRIKSAYPRFSISWLVSGEGESEDPRFRIGFSSLSLVANPIITLPVYSNLADHELDTRPHPDTVVYLSQSLCNGGKFASIYNSDALSPQLRQGALLLFRPCEPSDIVWDSPCYVITPTSRSYRVLKRGSKPGAIRLTSSRSDIYPDKEISSDEIRELYLICAVINLTSPID